MKSLREISRRDMLRLLGSGAVGAAAVSMGAALPTPALAQTATPTATPVPPPPKPIAFFSFQVGTTEVTVIRDASRPLDPAIFGVTAPEGGVAQLLKENGVTGNLTNTFNVLLIKTDKSLALVDTGNGAVAGSLLVTLDALGIKRDTITDVIISHQHGDHVSGALTSGALTFPKAMYHYSEPEKAAVEKAQESAGVTNNKNILKVAGDASQLKIYKADAEIIPGIMSIASPGHTPGHMSFMLSSGGASMLCLVDAVLNSVVSVSHPEWHASFDGDKPLAVETRKKLLADAAAKQMRVLGYHFPFPGTGFISKAGDGYRFTPAL